MAYLVTMETAYFKRHQKDDLYNYYAVYGGPGKTKNGYLIGISFLNEAFPIIFTEHNYINDPSGLTGTWCQYEVGEPISKEEYQQMFDRASSHPDVKIF